MAITPGQYRQLVMAPVLQDYLVDKDTGAPLANGFVSLFQDISRTTFKNWYYQTGTVGNYTFLPLDNPLNLSSVGTIQDPNGNDVIPFFYPFDENNPTQVQTYFIQVNSSNPNGSMGALQFTRENFPFTPSSTTVITSNPTLRNYIVNNEFWHNFGSMNFTGTTSTIIAPSQHDGFQFPDITYFKDGTSHDTVSFAKFTSDNALDQNEVTPEFYLNVHCTASGTDTFKYVRIPLSLHLKTLSNQIVTVSFQGQNVSGASNNTIYAAILADTGTSAASAPVTSVLSSFTIGDNWQRNTISGTTPSVFNAPLSLSNAGDDAYYLLLGFSTAGTFNLNIAKPEVYLSTEVPNNDFDTYDDIDSIISSPRTGDFRTSLNNFQPFGWVQANDGVISNSGTIVTPTGLNVARRNVDTWQLFNLLWNNVNTTFAPIYDSTGAASTRVGSAISDWNLNKQIQLSLALGRSLIGLPPAVTITTYNNGSGVFTVPTPFANLMYVGSPINLTAGTGGTIPSAFTLNQIYYAIPINATTFQLASSYANALTRTAITGGTTGTSPFIVNWALGGAFGEARHIQLAGEVGAHTHPLANGANVWSTGAGHFIDFSGATNTFVETTIANNNPANVAFNIVQPSVYYNVYIKL